MTSWNAWAELRRREHILFDRRELPDATGGAIYARRNGWAVVLIDRRLGRRDRHAALAHELVHDERQPLTTMHGMPETWRPLVAREEQAVDREVARRLVPLEDLAQFCDRMADLGEGVAPWHVADEFDVPEDVARRALDALTRHERGTP